MSTYSDFLKSVRSATPKVTSEKSDPGAAFTRFVNRHKPADADETDAAHGNAEIPPPDAPAPTDGTTDAPDAGAPESATETPPEEADAPMDAPAPETMSAGALPEPDDDGDLFEPPQPQKRHGGRRK